jgi:hypothetical protein
MLKFVGNDSHKQEMNWWRMINLIKFTPGDDMNDVIWVWTPYTTTAIYNHILLLTVTASK